MCNGTVKATKGCHKHLEKKIKNKKLFNAKKILYGLRKIFMDKLKNTFIHYIVKLLFSLPKQQEKLQLPVT